MAQDYNLKFTAKLDASQVNQQLAKLQQATNGQTASAQVEKAALNFNLNQVNAAFRSFGNSVSNMAQSLGDTQLASSVNSLTSGIDQAIKGFEAFGPGGAVVALALEGMKAFATAAREMAEQGESISGMLDARQRRIDKKRAPRDPAEIQAEIEALEKRQDRIIHRSNELHATIRDQGVAINAFEGSWAQTILQNAPPMSLPGLVRLVGLEDFKTVAGTAGEELAELFTESEENRKKLERLDAELDRAIAQQKSSQAAQARLEESQTKLEEAYQSYIKSRGRSGELKDISRSTDVLDLRKQLAAAEKRRAEADEAKDVEKLRVEDQLIDALRLRIGSILRARQEESQAAQARQEELQATAKSTVAAYKRELEIDALLEGSAEDLQAALEQATAQRDTLITQAESGEVSENWTSQWSDAIQRINQFSRELSRRGVPEEISSEEKSFSRIDWEKATSGMAAKGGSVAGEGSLEIQYAKKTLDETQAINRNIINYVYNPIMQAINLLQ